MTKHILSQGITPDIEHSVGSTLIRFLTSDQYHTFTGISAFASEAGINGLSSYIEQANEHYSALNLIVGVDQQSTSKEALEAILNLNINSYIFYQTGFSIFHPKIYLFEGEPTSQLIIGSSNLTAQGLFVNIEASILLELSNTDPDDLEFIAVLKARFAGLFDFSDPNLKPITPELIEHFVREKIVPTEDSRKETQEKLKELETPQAEPIERIIKQIFPKRSLPSIPSEFKSKKSKKAALPDEESTDVLAEIAGVDLIEIAENEHFTLMWEMLNVPGSSVQVTKSANTNPTGMLRLVQADYAVNGTLINQTSYFRNVVFNGLSWVPETAKTEIAIGKFHVSILGNQIGEHPLKIRHKPSGEAGQGNYTTGLSWGSIGKVIQDNNLAGRTVRLYRLDGSNDIFKLEIL